ncbi:MAG: DNA repair protein RadA [Flavobacteriales bacterium]|nr:DNA repair protein RadA [Flavobacteriales bacterium]
MSKTKTAFFCQECGHESPKWVGKCPNCGAWNTYVEELVVKTDAQSKRLSINTKSNKPRTVDQLETEMRPRMNVVDSEFHRVLGGGLVYGSVILFGGEPGIGKSTLMLQFALQQQDLKTLYVSGEESEEQIKLRVDRLGMKNPKCFVLMETRVEQIINEALEMQPDVLVVDSIQTLYNSDIESSPGSVSQVRESAGRLLRFAKETGTVVFIVGHITKEGTLAGPKLLEHMVDTVLQFEGDRHHVYRLLRTPKNRFGSTNELGIYEMEGSGLKPVDNPSQILLENRGEHLSGIAIAATLEGMRPMLLEIQALVSTAVYGTPQRSTTGFDIRRLNMLLAVLEKRCGFKLAMKDVFLNVAGGIKVEDPAMDLAVITAILSSGEDIAIPARTCFTGEVGLSGEIRPVARIDQRIAEAAKLGFEEIYVSSYNKGLTTVSKEIRVVQVGRVDELFGKVFG